MSSLAHARIGQIVVVCQDMARARAFYKETLGLRHLFDAGQKLAFFEVGGIRLMLGTQEGKANGTSVLYFFVADIEATTHVLTLRGVRFLGEPRVVARMPDRELWLAEFRDSEDNLLALMEEKRV